MLKKLTKLLSRKLDTTAAVSAAINEIDLDALRSAHDEAVRKRASLLLTGSDAEILAAEKDADAARLAVDRAEAALAELEKRRVEAEAAEAAAAILRQYEETRAKVDALVAEIEAEYPGAAQRIAELAERSGEVDEAVREWNHLAFNDPRAWDHGTLEDTAGRLGWSKMYAVQLDFAGAIRLLPLRDFAGTGVDWPTADWHFAVNGTGGPAVPTHQFA